MDAVVAFRNMRVDCVYKGVLTICTTVTSATGQTVDNHVDYAKELHNTPSWFAEVQKSYLSINREMKKIEKSYRSVVEAPEDLDMGREDVVKRKAVEWNTLMVREGMTEYQLKALQTTDRAQYRCIVNQGECSVCLTSKLTPICRCPARQPSESGYQTYSLTRDIRTLEGIPPL